MWEWVLALDPSVQVALIGGVTALGGGIYGVIRVVLDKEDEHHHDIESIRIERLIAVLDALTDAIERHRQQLSIMK